MKKGSKKKPSIVKNGITFTFSEELSKLEGQNLAPKKLEKANEMLKNLKSPLPR